MKKYFPSVIKQYSSACATNWFQGSALEPTALQALPAESPVIRVSYAKRSEAEPRGQCVPRQSLGTRNIIGILQREVSIRPCVLLSICMVVLLASTATIGKVVAQEPRFRNIWARHMREEIDPWVVMPGAANASLPGKGKKIVLISGDEEYRSEESMPMLGKILSEQHGYDCVVLFSINPETHTVDPNYQSNIPGLHHLDDADGVIMSLRFRSLPDLQMAHIERFMMEGKPFVALRTSTHPFNFPADSKSLYKKWAYNSKEWEGGFGQQIVGETWHSHHGAHASQATRGVIPDAAKASAILRGVSDVFGPSDVYGVVRLPSSATILLQGQVLKGMNPTDPPLEGPKNNPMMPLAWTKDYQMPNGKTGRLFCTTMGAANDFLCEDLRRLIVNATYWMTGLEAKIPARASATVSDQYQPNNFGFKAPTFFKEKLLKPIDLVK